MASPYPITQSADWQPPRWSNANEERLLDEALTAAFVPGQVLAESIRPPLPQIQLFPPRYGYDQVAPTVVDVIKAARLYPDNRRWLSGGPWDWMASSRNSMASTGWV